MRRIASTLSTPRRVLALVCAAMALASACLLTACGASSTPVETASESEPPQVSDTPLPSSSSPTDAASSATSEADAIVADMTLEEKVAQMFIVKPVFGFGGSMNNLFSTHPPIEERIQRLVDMNRTGQYS